MTDAIRKRVFIQAFIFYYAVIGAAFLINLLTESYKIKPLIEGGIGFFVVLLFVSCPPVAYFIHNLPKPYKIVCVIFFFLMATSQYLSKMRYTFPFMTWNMFTETVTADQTEIFEFVGVTAGGKQIMLNPNRFFPPIDHASLVLGIERRIQRLKPNQLAGVSVEKHNVNKILIAMAHMFNRQHQDPIARIDILTYALPVSHPLQGNISKQVLWSIDMSTETAP